MKKLGIAVLAAASIMGATAQSSSAADVPGPCERQQKLFETYNIQTDMNAPPVAWAYNTACGVTG